MTLTAVILSALFFLLLGTMYVKGYDIVKKHSPEHLVHFYIILATIRFILVASVVGVYAFTSPDRTDTIHFAMMFLGMYVAMMVITLILKH